MRDPFDEIRKLNEALTDPLPELRKDIDRRNELVASAGRNALSIPEVEDLTLRLDLRRNLAVEDHDARIG